ncbi:beta-Ig-H3 fasciclin [Chlorella sorokiniana]|uniref:Beta-Ig-H3 fasciclin n=1 Tax=Chlorella sorokiniana TaxID=3076 RepID=A0A2P6TUY4_CHLSO|nr:beta-Ig-H3 fasciclin [Chlorella sorokiniana]|eukprot:PRW57877.1 beta-Ig-H3 fasciclin [Chlorella sorokiniana]
MASRKQLAALVLLGLCAAAAAAGRELQAKKATPYAANLYEAITKAKLVTLKAAIDASGLTMAFMNPNLDVTLFAPTEEAWQRFYRDCAKPPKKAADVAKYCSLNKLLTANKQELQQFVQYMVLYGKATVEAGNDWWPKGRTFVKKPTLFNKNIMRLRYLAPYFEAHGTGRDGNVTIPNLGAGRSLLHVIDNVPTYSPLG